MDAGTEKPAALYRLIEDEAQHEILTARDLVGFFAEPSGEASPPVRMIGTSLLLERAPTHFYDVELQVLDYRREIIGAYYIGEVEVVEAQPSSLVDGTDLEMSLQGYSLPFPHAGEIWRRWASGGPRGVGEWRKLPPEWHLSWLHVAQTAWFQAGRLATRYEPKPSYVIDGNGIANTDSFFCALGEAINGPGGYFGSGLDALADCLSHATAGEHSFELVCRNFDVSEMSMSRSDLDSIVGVFQEFGVRLLVRTS